MLHHRTLPKHDLCLTKRPSAITQCQGLTPFASVSPGLILSPVLDAMTRAQPSRDRRDSEGLWQPGSSPGRQPRRRRASSWET
jgi:hypothetical protein